MKVAQSMEDKEIGSKEMFIVDAHEDIAYIALYEHIDVRRSLQELRARKNATIVSLPEHRRGGIGLVFASIFTPPASPEITCADGYNQLAYYHKLAHTEPGVQLIYTRHDLDRLVHDWYHTTEPDNRPIGLVLLMEGADPIRDPSELVEWYQRGLRIVGPSWERTRYAGGTGFPGPLTNLGRALLPRMEKLGIILDISHLAEESFWQAMDIFHGSVIASHANCRVYAPTDRQLTDDMIRTIAERDGVIGIALLNIFLESGWTPETGVPLTLTSVILHIDHICQLTGSSTHCAIGSDFGVGFDTPIEFSSVADLEKLADALSNTGYSNADIANIMGENWLRLLRHALPE